MISDCVIRRRLGAFIKRYEVTEMISMM